jgi:hypothetical protein
MVRLFGAVPASLIANVGELEQLRVLRNAVGHEFGRRNTLYPFLSSGVDAQRVSEERIKKWLGLIDQIAVALDEQIGSKHVVTFELLSLYYYNKEKLRT